MTDLAECIEWMIGGRKLGVVAVGLVTHFVVQPGPDGPGGPASGIVPGHPLVAGLPAREGLESLVEGGGARLSEIEPASG